MKVLLKDRFPELRKQWSSKNILDFDEVTCGSAYRAIWECECGNVWDVDICSRVSKRPGKPTSCPKCKKKSVSDKNSLLINYPNIAKEYDTNNKLGIEWISYGSNRLVNWICSNGHKYHSIVRDRASKGNGCPYCSGRLATPETSIANKFPELLKEWDYERNKLDPNCVTYGSGSKVYWRCSNGHSWVATVCDRTSKRRNGCPKCVFWQSSKMELFIYCEIKYYYPDALHRHRINKMECDIFIPSLNIGIEIDGGLWHKYRLDWDKNKYNVLKNSGVTLIHVREEILESFNDFTVTFPKAYSIFNDIAKPLMRLLYVITNDDRLSQYAVRVEPINNEEYSKMIEIYPDGHNMVTGLARKHVDGHMGRVLTK